MVSKFQEASLKKAGRRERNTSSGEMFAFLYFFFLAMPVSMWDFNSPTRDQTHAHCLGSMES